MLGLPPIRNIVAGADGLFDGPWQRWITQLYGNSAGNSTIFSPVITGMSGSVTATGTYNLVGGLVYFNVLIKPATSCTSTLGTTKITLPFTSKGYGSLTALNTSSRISLGTGQIDINTAFAYVPAWTAIANPILVTGFVQI